MHRPPPRPVRRALTWTLPLALMLALAAWPSVPASAGDQPAKVLLTQDSPDQPGLPLHFRTMDGPFRDLQGDSPSRLGLEELRASGSAQFCEQGLQALKAKLPPGVVVVDLRQESHGFVNGVAVSWYGVRNWANLGKSALWVQSEEIKLLQGLLAAGRATLAPMLYKGPDFVDTLGEPINLTVTRVASEGRLCAAQGLGYLRLAVPDHRRPDDAEVEAFLRLWRRLPPEAWLHFHCRAGKGRTTTFLAMCDMLKNAGRVSQEDIGRRQQLLGGIDLLGGKDQKGWKAPYGQERGEFLKEFYEFARQGAAGNWSDWLASQPKAAAR